MSKNQYPNLYNDFQQVGGETAEMPDMYADGEYDLAGFAVGAVERTELLPRTNEIRSGDLVFGLSSSGVHSNGFSLVRRVLKLADKSYQDPAPFSDTGKTIGALTNPRFSIQINLKFQINTLNLFDFTGEELLEPTKIYVKGVMPALRSGLVKGFAHITGGGLTDNIPRVLPNGTGVSLDANTWNIPPIFGWLAVTGTKTF